MGVSRAGVPRSFEVFLEQLASYSCARLEAIWRQNLSIAQRDEEIIENLREAQWGRWRKEMLKAEQKVLDDLANRRPQKKTFLA